ncbi:MAG: alpha/beta fold hydrolase [Vicinamibacterales bacterium]
MDSSTFDAAGPTSDRTIVLAHGSVVTRKVWLPQLRGLSDAFRVIAPDLPGHGARAGVPFSFDAAARELAALIEREARGRVVVVGMSLGGYAAIELAARRPELVSGLVLSGCSRNFRGALGLYLKTVSALMRRGWLAQSRAAAEKKTRALFPPELSGVAEAQIAAGVYPEALGAAFGEMAGKDFGGLLARYTGPVLILNGEKDSLARKGEQAFAAACRDARVVVLPGAGHACSLDQPAAFNAAVREFAARV